MKSLRDRHARHLLAAAGQHVAVVFDRVEPFHPLQHARCSRDWAGTCRYGQTFGSSRTASSRSSVMSLGEVGDELDALDARRVVDARQQVATARYGRPSPELVLVAVDGLAQQRDFLAALGGELADLGGDVLRRPALLRAAHARHDAVGAELVAADHDADVGLERRRPHRRVAQRVVALEAALDLVARRFVAVEADRASLRLAGLLDLGDQSGSCASWPVPQMMSTCGARLEDQLLVLLGHAAEDADDLVGMAALVAAQPAQGAVDLVLGVLADGAGVERITSASVGSCGQLVALAAQAADDQLAVEHVHLAADGFDVEFLGHDLRRRPFPFLSFGEAPRRRASSSSRRRARASASRPRASASRRPRASQRLFWPRIAFPGFGVDHPQVAVILDHDAEPQPAGDTPVRVLLVLPTASVAAARAADVVPAFPLSHPIRIYSSTAEGGIADRLIAQVPLLPGSEESTSANQHGRRPLLPDAVRGELIRQRPRWPHHHEVGRDIVGRILRSSTGSGSEHTSKLGKPREVGLRP